MNSKSCVIIPYFKSGDLIINVLDQIPDIIDYVFMVDDKSPVPLPLIEYSKYTFEIVVISHDSNKGVGGAMKTGFKKALEYEDIKYIFKVDSDDQMDLTKIPKMRKHLIKKHCDFVKGNRLYDINIIKKMPFIRRFGNLILSFLTKFCTGYWNVQDPTNGFFGIKRSALKKLDFNKLHDSYFFETSVLGELFLVDSLIVSLKMPPIYKNEVSNMNVLAIPFEFLPKLLKILVRRVYYKYFLFNLNIGSIYLFFSITIFLFGIGFGSYHYQRNFSLGVTTPAGTVIIFALAILISFNLFLSWLDFDTKNFPRKENRF